MSEEGSDKRVGIAAYARSIASALEQRGVDAAQVFEQAGVPMYNTTDPLRRMTNREISALFRESVAITSVILVGSDGSAQSIAAGGSIGAATATPTVQWMVAGPASFA